MTTVVVPAQPRTVEPPEPAYRVRPEPAISPEPIGIAPPRPPSASLPSSNLPSSNLPSPVPTVPAVPTEPPRAQASGRYYVVTEYTSDFSLRAARGAVPDAYVRNIPSEGAKVQLGAFSDEAGAAEFQQDLRQQGIEAEVYRP
jgi:hypothetical protein